MSDFRGTGGLKDWATARSSGAVLGCVQKAND